LYRIAATIYNVYTSKKLDIAHFRTIMTLFLIGLLLYADLVLLFRLPINFFSPLSKTGDTKQLNWLRIASFYLLIIILIAAVFNKKKLEKVKVNEKQVSKASKLIPIIFIVLILLMTILLIFSGLIKGTI
jgi:hypothetical protein